MLGVQGWGSDVLVAQAVLLDADGTLIDSGDAVRRAYVAWSREHGIDPDHAIALSHGRRSTDAVAELVPTEAAPAAIARLDAIELEELSGIVPVPGSLALLETLARLGVPHAVVTSGSRALVTARSGAAGLPLPPVVVTADDVSTGKPDPTCYVHAAGLLGIDPAECVVVEDALSGVLAGVAAGATVLGVATAQSPAVLKAAGAAAVVTDLRQVAAVLVSGGVALHLS